MEGSEKCPICGNVMDKGSLISPRGITWWPDKPFSSVWHKGENIVPSANVSLRNNTPHLPAHRCRKCGVILIHIPKIEKSTE